MRLEEIDEAFNWLVLILGTIAAALIQSVHLYPLRNPPLTPEIEMQFMRLLFVPLIVLVICWLGSHLIQSNRIRAVLKPFSWIYALMLLYVDLVYFLAVVMGQDIRTPISILGTFWIPSAVYLVTIPKRYRALFPESKFLKSNIAQVLFCILVSALAVAQAATSAPLL